MNTIKTADAKIHTDYKNSGSPWLGEIPKHWTTARLKQVCSQYALYGANVQASEYSASGIRFIRTSDITEGGNLQPEGVYIPTELVPEHILTDGDILLSRSGTIGRSFHYQSDRYGPCSYAGYLVRFVPGPKAQSRYVYLFTKTPAFQNAAKAVAISSTIENVNAEKYANITVPVPPPEDQAAIVRYLDKADQQIQAYIGAKQKLITLLEEERQAIIRQAVTRGLDPNVRLKASGVEWLGDVPEHWQTRRLRTVADMRVSNVDKHTNEDESPVRLCNYVDVYKNERITEDIPFMHASASPDEIERFRLIRNDVIITKDSETWDDIGVPALVEYSATDLVCGYHLAILRPTEIVHGPFLARALQSETVCRQFHVGAKGVTRYGLAQNAIQDALIPLPPLREQKVIAKQLDQDTKAIDVTKKAAHQQIELMQEYRTRLIADAVTGKIDVRKVAEELPQLGPAEIID